MPACAIPGCPALPDAPSPQCAIHRKYQLMPDHNRLKPMLCGRCMRTIRKGEWYAPHGEQALHLKPCKPPKAARV